MVNKATKLIFKFVVMIEMGYHKIKGECHRERKQNHCEQHTIMAKG